MSKLSKASVALNLLGAPGNELPGGGPTRVADLQRRGGISTSGAPVFAASSGTFQAVQVQMGIAQ
jgi:hypothetical protein